MFKVHIIHNVPNIEHLYIIICIFTTWVRLIFQTQKSKYVPLLPEK